MDGRQVYPKALGRSPQETLPGAHVLSHGFRMVDPREHDMLVAEGHYRCPHCRRADALETSDTSTSRR
jgi:hypothetical protein